MARRRGRYGQAAGFDPRANLDARVRFDLQDSQAIYAWMSSQGMAAEQANEAIRALVQIALATCPQDGMAAARARQAYHETHVWLYQRFLQATKEIRSDLMQRYREMGFVPEITADQISPGMTPNDGGL